MIKFFRYLISRMPQVLQELIDSPLSTAYKCCSNEFATRKLTIIKVKCSFLYFLIVYHNLLLL